MGAKCMGKPKLAIIDYGSGNLRSVQRALEAAGAATSIVKSEAELEAVEPDAMVLPGQGAFGESIKQLHARELWKPILEWLAAKRPYLGICLGYQLLFETGEEAPGVRGFGIFKGTVRTFRFDDRNVSEGSRLKVPHIGWNQVLVRQPESGFWKSLGKNPEFYYVHSYFPEPEDGSVVAATTNYGGDFAAAVSLGDYLLATQFHPEKSQQVGQTLLRNFVDCVATHSEMRKTAR